MPFLLVLAALAGSAGSFGGIVDAPAPEWPAVRWVQGGPLRLADLRGKVVLVRFFMDSRCPLCNATAPSLNQLHRDFAGEGLVIVGLYTPKPRPRKTSVAEVREYVNAFGFQFPIGVDDDWSVLRRLWLDRARDARFTSASLLIDRKGIVRHVHEGGIYARESKDESARRDYRAMRRAIVKALGER